MVDTESGGTTAGTKIQQWADYGSTLNRNQLFKITFLATVNNQHYYSIRSMTNSALGLSTSATNGNVTLQAMSTIDTYNDIDTEHRWIIKAVDTGVYAFQTASLSGDYLSTGGSTTNGQQLTTVDTLSSSCYWTLRQYTGETINGAGFHQIPAIGEGETMHCKAFVYCSIANRNGPPIYSLHKTEGDVSEYATINAITGEITALKSGIIQVGVTYTNAPYIWLHELEIYTFHGIYYLQNKESEKFMQPSIGNSITLEQSSFSDELNQAWCFFKNSAGYFKIRQAGTSLCLTSPVEETVGSSITLAEYSMSTSRLQLWVLLSISDDCCQIVSEMHENTNLRLSLASGSPTQDGLQIQQQTNSITSDKDKWVFIGRNNVISGVPTSLRSNNNHMCIPCAVTNVAAYYSNLGYSEFDCTTAEQQEVAANFVHAIMDANGGWGTNDLIPFAFSVFLHSEGNTTYRLSATNYPDKKFSVLDIIEEIDQGRPVLLGYNNHPDTPYVYHMTVCTGYSMEDGNIYVYVSDAHNSGYQKHLFNTAYNDFICKVVVVSE